MKNVITLLGLAIFYFFAGCNEDTVDLLGVGTLTGRVVEAKSFDPIENAKITLSPTNNTVFSDIDGYFLFEGVEAGDYSVSSTKEGYLTNFQPITIATDLEVNVVFEMEDDNALNKSPATPVLISPEDNIKNQEISIKFIWSSSDPDNDELVYRLEIKNDKNNEVFKIENLSDTTYMASELNYGTKYFWQVAVSDDINNEVLSPVNSFKTKIDPENRYFYVKEIENSNNVIFSSSFNEDVEGLDNEVQLTAEDKNSFRPRKNKSTDLIAFLRSSNNETHIFTMKLDGSEVNQVTSAVPVGGFDLNEIDFTWSSNGDRLLYPHFNKLYVINKDGSGLKEVFETFDGNYITECSWSDDESLVALKTNNIDGYNVSIFTIDINGNILTEVLKDVTGAAGGLDISVDNKYLLYTYDISEFEDMSYRQLDTRVFLYEFSTNSIKDLSVNKENGFLDIDPRFSPNEAEVIFVNTSNDGLSEKSILKLSVSASNNSRTILFPNASMPDWE